jgi:hypothetical protein
VGCYSTKSATRVQHNYVKVQKLKNSLTARFRLKRYDTLNNNISLCTLSGKKYEKNPRCLPMGKKTDQSLKFSNSNPCSSLYNQTTVTSFLVLVNISNDYLTEKKKKKKNGLHLQKRKHAEKINGLLLRFASRVD